MQKYIATGALIDQPEVRFGKSGKAFVRVRMEVEDSYELNGAKYDKVFYITLVVFGKPAVEFAQKAKEGQPIKITGRLQTSRWENREGVTQYTTRCVVESFKVK